MVPTNSPPLPGIKAVHNTPPRTYVITECIGCVGVSHICNFPCTAFRRGSMVIPGISCLVSVACSAPGKNEWYQNPTLVFMFCATLSRGFVLIAVGMLCNKSSRKASRFRPLHFARRWCCGSPRPCRQLVRRPSDGSGALLAKVAGWRNQLPVGGWRFRPSRLRRRRWITVSCAPFSQPQGM